MKEINILYCTSVPSMRTRGGQPRTAPRASIIYYNGSAVSKWLVQLAQSSLFPTMEMHYCYGGRWRFLLLRSSVGIVYNNTGTRDLKATPVQFPEKKHISYGEHPPT